MKPIISPAVLSLLLLFAASPVLAQVYKCTSAGNKVIYSDKACVAGSSQIMTDIQTRSKSLDTASDSTVPNAKTQNSPSESAFNRQLDDAVKLAISNDDLIRAQALATTKEQKQWVITAKKEASKKVASSDSSADKANSYACQQAQRNLQKETDSSFQDQTLIIAKTNLMYSKCGVSVADTRYANRLPSSLINPGFFNPGFFNPGRYPHQPWPGNVQPGYTSEPYDRTRASPFGSRWIRPEN